MFLLGIGSSLSLGPSPIESIDISFSPSVSSSGESSPIYLGKDIGRDAFLPGLRLGGGAEPTALAAVDFLRLASLFHSSDLLKILHCESPVWDS